MNEKKEMLNALILQFVKLMNRYNELEKKAIDFGIGQKLYPSEIHTIEAIGNSEGIIARDLARELGVTKGAVSQIITKLYRKGLIQKKRAEDNEKEILLFLTDEGRKAYRGHEEFHRNMYNDFFRIFDDIPHKQFDFFEYLLEKIDLTLKGYQEKLKK